MTTSNIDRAVVQSAADKLVFYKGEKDATVKALRAALQSQQAADLRGVSDAQGLPSLAAPAQTTGESSGHPTIQAAAQAAAVAPDFPETTKALRFLDSVELAQGGANGPSIQLRGAILAMNAAWNAAQSQAAAQPDRFPGVGKTIAQPVLQNVTPNCPDPKGSAPNDQLCR